MVPLKDDIVVFQYVSRKYVWGIYFICHHKKRKEVCIINDKKFARKMKQKSPLIPSCITNPISMNQCANAILAMGACPIMADVLRR